MNCHEDSDRRLSEARTGKLADWYLDHPHNPSPGLTPGLRFFSGAAIRSWRNATSWFRAEAYSCLLDTISARGCAACWSELCTGLTWTITKHSRRTRRQHSSAEFEALLGASWQQLAQSQQIAAGWEGSGRFALQSRAGEAG